MEELNKKIAKWLGGRLARYYEANPNAIEPNHAYFTHSLDACFEYIVPKLRLMYLTIWEGFEAHLAVHTTNERYKVYVGKAETPALALCRAVEKLIDG